MAVSPRSPPRTPAATNGRGKNLTTPDILAAMMDSDSEDEVEASIRVGHSQFHAYLERRISPDAVLVRWRALYGRAKWYTARCARSAHAVCVQCAHCALAVCARCAINACWPHPLPNM